MDIRKKEIIADLRVFEAALVSRDYGRACLQALEAENAIKPRRTPTGRCLLSIEDAERLANSF